jgi:putative nucleotidyltransferase with HDIG domain
MLPMGTADDDLFSVEAARAVNTSRPRRAIERSLTLLRVFLVASAAILLAAGLLLGWVLTKTLREQALADSRASLTQYVDGVLGPELVHGNRVLVAPRVSNRLLEELRRNPDLVTVKVWRADGVLAWTNRGRGRIGRRFELDGDLGEAIRTNAAAGSIDHLSSGEDAVERSLGYDHILEVYAPIPAPHGGGPIGAYEIYADPRALETFVASRKHVVWAVVGGVFIALYLALALLVRGASTMLRRQTRALGQRSRALLDSYRRLEESSLEAIESLNATVEAKDPYTAGHSQRVQQIALAIGLELDVPPDQFDALSFGALFHDIGKLAVPDAVLTKPDRLTEDEYERIKRHSSDGARIVGKLGRLRAAVPLIRHHHERWDGSGYPDGLAGNEIPRDAAIVALADAWDAMTTDRPYHRALTREEASDEIRRGRGGQFDPEVVDAFFAVLRRRPADLPGEMTLTHAVVG